jgi:putative DNA-invertase from lambdoid prophage Rac
LNLSRFWPPCRRVLSSFQGDSGPPPGIHHEPRIDNGHLQRESSRRGESRGLTALICRGFLAREGRPRRVAIYARVSTHDQQTLEMQVEAMSAYIKNRGWMIAKSVEDVGSGARERPGRESLLMAARRREIDVMVVWRLDRWGRSVADLMTTLRELSDLGVGFVSLTEALDPTTPSGRAMAGMLAIFAEFEREILRERVRAGIAQARKEGRPHGRPRTASLKADEVLRLKAEQLSPSEIARRLGIGRTSVRRILEEAD